MNNLHFFYSEYALAFAANHEISNPYLYLLFDINTIYS